MQHSFVRFFVLTCLILLIVLNVSGCSESNVSPADKVHHQAWAKVLGRGCDDMPSVHGFLRCTVYIRVPAKQAGETRVIKILGIHADGRLQVQLDRVGLSGPLDLNIPDDMQVEGALRDSLAWAFDRQPQN
jgi:hypothetical protein